MLKLLYRFDDFNLDSIYQKIADFIGMRFGISCFRLANALVVVSCALNLGYPLFRHFRFQERIEGLPFLCFMSLVYLVIYIGQVKVANEYRQGYGNKNRLNGKNARLFLIYVSMCDFYITPMGVPFLNLVCYISSLYFMACVPLPPQKSTVRMLLEKLLPEPQLVPVPVKNK